MTSAAGTLSSPRGKSAAQSTAGSDPLNLVSAFSDVLQASLKVTTGTTTHAGKPRGESAPGAPATSGAPALSDAAPSATLAAPLFFQPPFTPADRPSPSFPPEGPSEELGSEEVAGKVPSGGAFSPAKNAPHGAAAQIGSPLTTTWDPRSPLQGLLSEAEPPSDGLCLTATPDVADTALSSAPPLSSGATSTPAPISFPTLATDIESNPGPGLAETGTAGLAASRPSLSPAQTLDANASARLSIAFPATTTSTLVAPAPIAASTQANSPAQPSSAVHTTGAPAVTPTGTVGWAGQPAAAPPSSASQGADSAPSDTAGASVSGMASLPHASSGSADTPPAAAGDPVSFAALFPRAFASHALAASIRNAAETAVAVPTPAVSLPDARRDVPEQPVASPSEASPRRTSGGVAASAKNAPPVPSFLRPVTFSSAPARTALLKSESVTNAPPSGSTVAAVSDGPAESAGMRPLFTPVFTPGGMRNSAAGGSALSADPAKAGARKTFFPPAQAGTGATDSDSPAASSAADKTAGTSFAASLSLDSGTAGASSAAPAIPAIMALPGPDHNDSKSGSPGSSATRNTLPQRPEDGPELSAGLQAWNGGEGVSAAAAPSDQLVGKLAQSEMNVALRADGLGAVQVRAHVTGDQVGAAITVERHDAHAVLTSDLPALHQALSDRQLRVENVSLLQGSPHAGSGIGEGAGRQQNPDGTPQRSSHSGGMTAPFWGAAENTLASDASETRTAFDSNGRLSVQA